MKILHLTLKRKWFDQIAMGIKKEEYRVIKAFWAKRLVGIFYDEVHFRNGYTDDRPFMRVEWLRTTIDNKNGVFVIGLGKILEIKNWHDPTKKMGEKVRCDEVG